MASTLREALSTHMSNNIWSHQMRGEKGDMLTPYQKAQEVISGIGDFHDPIEIYRACKVLADSQRVPTAVLAGAFLSQDDSFPSLLRHTPELVKVMIQMCGYLEIGILNAKSVFNLDDVSITVDGRVIKKRIAELNALIKYMQSNVSAAPDLVFPLANNQGALAIDIKDHNPTQTSAYQSITPTAVLIAYLRTFSDIPFSNEIYQEINNGEDYSGLSNLAPRYEARHKIIDQTIKSEGNPQVLEIAAGFSSRGVGFAKERISNYVEMDLPLQFQNKFRLIRQLQTEYGVQVPGSLVLRGGNGLNIRDIHHAIRHLDLRHPITVVNEGLMRYLNRAEKYRLATNIHMLLSRFGGVWITPDITTSTMALGTKMEELSGVVGTIAGINVGENIFQDEDEAEAFFEDIGFSVEKHSFSEVNDKLVSQRKLGITDEDIEKLTKSSVLFKMRALNKS